MRQKAVKNFYEIFHRSTKFQKKLISAKNFTYRNTLKILLSYLDKGKGRGRILDIGCGSGAISLLIASRGHNVVGIDISRKAIKACRLSAEIIGVQNKAQFFVGDFMKIDFNERFNLIFCGEVIEHIEKDELALRRAVNLLIPGGILLLSVPSKNSPLYKVGLLKRFDKQVGHLRRYSEEELVKIITKEDLIILEIKKAEGVLRNFFFVSRFGGLFVRVLNKSALFSDAVTLIDNFAIKLLGESQIIILAQKL